MRLLLDAQLPVRLVALMSSLGHDVVHASDLPAGNRTDDAEVSRAADASDRMVVAKDRDSLDPICLVASLYGCCSWQRVVHG